MRASACLAPHTSFSETACLPAEVTWFAASGDLESVDVLQIPADVILGQGQLDAIAPTISFLYKCSFRLLGVLRLIRSSAGSYAGLPVVAKRLLRTKAKNFGLFFISVFSRFSALPT